MEVHRPEMPHMTMTCDVFVAVMCEAVADGHIPDGEYVIREKCGEHGKPSLEKRTASYLQACAGNLHTKAIPVLSL